MVQAGRRLLRPEEGIVEATWCYYHEGLNQSAIADRLGISRATVVNYLAEARRREYVRVTLDAGIFRTHHLAERLRSRFGLADALVVPVEPGNGRQSMERVTRATADWLPDLLRPGDCLGVAWGETVFRVAEAAPRLGIEDLTVVQLVGSRPAGLGFAAELCSGTLAQRFGANVVNLHVPLLLTDRDLADRLRAEPVVVEQLAAVAGCNKTLFACGTVDDESHIRRTGLLDPERLAAYRAAGATGVICARLIDAEGRPMKTHIDDRMIGVSLEQMRGKDMGLLVAAGSNRAAPALAAIRGGFVTHLATCSDTAALLLRD